MRYKAGKTRKNVATRFDFCVTLNSIKTNSGHVVVASTQFTQKFSAQRKRKTGMVILSILLC